MSVCESCRKVVPEGAAYCPHCGAKTGSAQVLPTAPKEKVVIEQSAPRTSFPRANIGKRLIAGTIDVLITFFFVFVLYGVSVIRATARWMIIPYLLPCAYLLLRDGFRGRSVGKMLTGLVTYNVRVGKKADFADSIIRNWFMVVIIIPPRLLFINLGMFLFAFLAMIIFIQIISGHKKRLGDGFANTQVIDLRHLD